MPYPCNEPHAEPCRPRRHLLGATLALPLMVRARAEPRVLRVGQSQAFRNLSEAVRAAGSGDVIELEPGDYAGDVAVVALPRLTIRGLGAGAVFHAAGRSAEGKAILVVRGDVLIENLEFRGARVPDGNGAGIRFERGNLRLRHCRFFDNEMGLLTANDPRMTLEVEQCEFGAAPRHEGSLHHLLYVGTIGHFSIRDSRLGGGWRGHLLKSRAARSEVLNNRLDDRPSGEASYELEFPNGGHNTVVGNLIAQSARTQNPDLLSMGAEARDGMGGSLTLERNTFVNAAGPEARFVQIWTERLAGEVPVRMTDNRFIGPGRLHLPAPWDGGGNQRLSAAPSPSTGRNPRSATA